MWRLPKNDKNGFMVYFLMFNKGGLDESSPYNKNNANLKDQIHSLKKSVGLMNQTPTKICGLDESSPYRR